MNFWIHLTLWTLSIFLGAVGVWEFTCFWPNHVVHLGWASAAVVLSMWFGHRMSGHLNHIL